LEGANPTFEQMAQHWFYSLRTMCGSRTGGWSLPSVMSD
jgi:hypothetical protein